MGHYQVSIVCKNGHLITGQSHTGDTSNNRYCRDCGAETIASCENCHAPIKGKYKADGVLDLTSYTYVPSFCHSCGNPYPWTLRLFETAKKLIELDEYLSTTEKTDLVESASNIMIESNTSGVYASIFKKLADKTGNFVKDSLYQFAVDVASETAKKIIFPD